MISLLRSIANFIIDPINFLFLLALLIFISHVRKNSKWVKRLMVVFFLIFLLGSTSFIPDLLIGHLEKKYPPLSRQGLNFSDRPVDILVLGSGHTADPDLPALAQLSSSALQRLTEGIRLFEFTPNAQLIVSGYGDKSAKAQAEVLGEAAISLGIPAERIFQQPGPTNTEEEAKSYREKYGSDHQLILVTSAAHMPRAMYLFRKENLDPIAAPTGFEVADDPTVPFNWDIFSSRNFRKVEAALHEYLGMLWAKIRGHGA